MKVFIVVKRETLVDIERVENICVFNNYRTAIRFINEQKADYKVEYGIDEFEVVE
jgi:hypothetical protein